MAEEKASKIKFITRVEVLLGVLACCSIVLIALPQRWFAVSYEFVPGKYASSILGDKQSGGNSIVQWVNEAEQIWRCDLGNISPVYCSFLLDIRNENGMGLDLSKFTTMTVWLDYKGNAQTGSIYLRNAGDPYYKKENSSTTKYNQVLLPLNKLADGFTVNMEMFAVADWWLAYHNISLEHSYSDFNDIHYIEVQLGGGGGNSGRHEFNLKRIVWKGVALSNEEIFRGLILAWIILIFILLVAKLIKLKYRLIKDKKQQAELAEINKLLEIQNKEFVDIAKTDQLTGLLNRVGIRDALYENLKMWKEKRIRFSVILIDIDHFKQVNDNWGHDIGDEVLLGVAGLLAGNTRKTDCLARWGGEEFLLICHDCDLYHAQRIAETIRKKLELAEIHPELRVTASFGLATLANPDLDDLFKRADEALYEAKSQGRNRVCYNTEAENYE